MTAPPSKGELRDLLIHHAPWSVSMYMPTREAGADTRQNHIRFKNRLQEAEQRLIEAGMRSADARSRLDPVRSYIGEEEFWQHQGRGLGVFLGGSEPRIYRLPIDVEEITVVGERFYLKPLLPLLSDGTRFHVLAISQNQVRLFKATRYDITQIDVPGAPSNMAEIMRGVEAEHEQQFHTRAAGHGPGRERDAVFHGQGVNTDRAYEKRRIRDFCHRVNAGVADLLEGQDAPLILAASEPILGIYREVNTYRHLHEQALRGNPDGADPRRLHEEAIELFAPTFEQARQAEADLCRQADGTDRGTRRLPEALIAAHNGQIRTLFVRAGEHRWGTYDPATCHTEEHPEPQPGDQDLLDLAAVQTCLGGGTVYAVPPEAMPIDASIAATLRFPVAYESAGERR